MAAEPDQALQAILQGHLAAASQARDDQQKLVQGLQAAILNGQPLGGFLDGQIRQQQAELEGGGGGLLDEPGQIESGSGGGGPRGAAG